MVDVSDPLNPTFAGCFGDDGYVHDAQCTIYTGPDIEHQGKEVCTIRCSGVLIKRNLTLNENFTKL